MFGGDSPTNRQNEAFMLRFQAEGQQKASLFFDMLAAIALYFGVLWLAIIFIVIAGILIISSIGLEMEANRLWPDPKDYDGEN